MPSRYSIEIYNDGPVPTYAVLLDTSEPDCLDDEAEGQLIEEFFTREEAEALKAQLELEDRAGPTPAP